MPAHRIIRKDKASDIFKSVYLLARKVTGYTWEQLYLEIGMGAADMNGKNGAQIAKSDVSNGKRIPFENFMVACKLAKIPTLMRSVLWAKASIPDEYAHLRKNIGLTYKGIKEQSWPGTPGFVREYLKEEITMGAKIIPDEPEDIHPGMILGKARTRY